MANKCIAWGCILEARPGAEKCWPHTEAEQDGLIRFDREAAVSQRIAALEARVAAAEGRVAGLRRYLEERRELHRERVSAAGIAAFTAIDEVLRELDRPAGES